MQTGLDFVTVKLLFHAGGAFVKILAILGRPPIAQVALAVELRALIVEAVGDFVADDGAHAAVVHGVVRFRIVEGRLHDARGKHDFIHAAAVVGVDGRRRHAPFRAVYGLADFVQPTRGFELRGAEAIHYVGGAVNLQGGIIAPLVRVADLHRERLEFCGCLRARLRAHPGKRLQIVTQSRD